MRNLSLIASGVALMAACIVAAPNNSRAADDIVDTAVQAGSFNTLAAALGAADLVEVLKGEGPFTVFAPTDEAFSKLPEGTVETLLKPENKEKLTGILTYHVVSGQVPANKVVELSGANTVNGQRVAITTSGGEVMVDQAKVVSTDIRCSNGIIHVIDNVILPTQDNIPETAGKAGKFTTLLTAAKAAGLVETLAGAGPLTVFAPTDEAFSRLPEGTVESLLKPENRNRLAEILSYHVVEGRVFSDAALKAKKATTLQGQTVHISATDGKARINKANLIATDINASNGVIHVIDAVLLPPEKVSAAQARHKIRNAVAHGSRLYNNGHHAQCASVYMSTIREMVDYGGELPTPIMASLTSTLTKAEAAHCPTNRAWTLRHGLDRAYHAMR